MNFTNKAQSINDYLDKYYEKLLKDGSMVRDYQTLLKQLQLETTKLSNYKFTIKEEIESELVRSQGYKNLDESDKHHILSLLERVHQELKIPEFTIVKEDCLELVNVSVETSKASTVQKQPQGVINIGTAIGAVVGLGISFIIQKSIPVILIGGIGGAAIGSFLGKGAGTNRKPIHPTVPDSLERQQMFGKVSPDKLGAVIQARKTAIKSLFSQYCKQLEAVCQTSLK
ncbi:hypothetical protein [Neobacillus citreus]|uniref:Uncharacterized protein n=1 Tax=Neobacillus citreus TaxID=2833578 RepID=A0A942YG34_9BACI|nr:hypothetical protein [Neobacillus citreus]MCH6266996.1 hypothetical protein [Neobacillus citreus]